MRMRRPPRQTPRIGSLEALDRYFDGIAAETMRRAGLRLWAEHASPERRATELAKTAEWLRQWRARAPAAVGRAAATSRER
jgi:hypothetical protein